MPADMPKGSNIKDYIFEVLNQFGQEGWELVDFKDSDNSAGTVRDCTLKRPLP